MVLSLIGQGFCADEKEFIVPGIEEVHRVILCSSAFTMLSESKTPSRGQCECVRKSPEGASFLFTMFP